MSKNETPTKVIVPCRFSYLHCWEPEAINGGEPKYSVSAIIPKSDKGRKQYNYRSISGTWDECR